MEENNRFVNVVNDPYQAANLAHAVAVLTEWDEFKNYDYKKIFKNMEKPAFLFDGRRILDKFILNEIGFNVYKIGE